MIVGIKKAVCVGKPEPFAWSNEGRSGVSYKIELSDGTSAIQLPCIEEAYKVFNPFQTYDVKIELTQTDYEGRKSIRGRVISASAVS